MTDNTNSETVSVPVEFISYEEYWNLHKILLNEAQIAIAVYWRNLDKTNALLYEVCTEPFDLTECRAFCGYHKTKGMISVNGKEKHAPKGARFAVTQINHAIISEFHTYLMNRT